MITEELRELRNLLDGIITADDTDRLEEILAQGNVQDVNANIFRYGKTLLMHAAEHGAVGCMQLLLAREDIDVNARDTNIYSTALMYAVQHAQTECVGLLLARTDLDINAITDDGNNVMSYAHLCKDIECLKLLLEYEGLDIYGLSGTTIRSATLNHNPALLKLLLQLGDLHVDAAEGTGLTALILSARDKDYETMKILLEHGANPNLADNDGQTPLKLALSTPILDDILAGDGNWRATECLRLLLSHGAEIPTEFDVLFATLIGSSQIRLTLCRDIKNTIKTSLDANEQLNPDLKILAEKIVNTIIFAQDTTSEQLQSAEFINSSIAQATTRATNIYQQIVGYDEATKNFILENAHFIDPSLDEDFKNWKVANTGLKKTLVNLAYVCGGQVRDIESLTSSKIERVQKFIASIPQDEDGNTLEYSIEEFKLIAISRNPIKALGECIDAQTTIDAGETTPTDNELSEAVDEDIDAQTTVDAGEANISANNELSAGENITKLIAGFLSTSDVLLSAREAPTADDATTITGADDNGPADAEA